QLGQREAPRGDRIARRRCRRVVPEHRAAVLRAGQSDCARTDRRRLRRAPGSARGDMTALEPPAPDYAARWAGLQAHNRWLADFCAAAPGRRAGCTQIFLNNLDDALAEARWAKGQLEGFGGILLPNVAPNSPLPPLWDPHYEPLWELCEEL